MKKSLLATTMIAGLMVAGAAQAADMPVKAPVRSPDCCVYANFGGWYLGINGGGGIASNYGATLTEDLSETPETLPINGKRSFGLVGVHGGYNWQMGQAVFGVEGDYSWVNAKSSTTFAEDATDGPGFDTVSAKLRSLASVRGRAGVVVGNLMVYGTAGWGWARTNFSFDDQGTILHVSRTTSGIVGGVGAEWYLTSVGPGSLLLRTEYLHYAFGGQSLTTFFNGDDSAGVHKAPDSVDVVRAGLTWKFP
jgi:outer membrane immunogenic protein